MWVDSDDQTGTGHIGAGSGRPPAATLQFETGSWQIEIARGRADDLHRLEVPTRRFARVHEVSAPALVLGSRQDPREVTGPLPDGTELAARRSGGGAVWLAPGAQVWIDLVVPVGDPLHTADVRAAAAMVGRAWADALAPEQTVVWDGGMTEPELSRVACFAGVGPGEVLLDGRKLVGISQRRNSAVSRFQCVAYLRWDPEVLLAAFSGSGRARSEPRSEVLERLSSVLRHGVATLPGSPLATRPITTSGDVTDLAGSLVAHLG